MISLLFQNHYERLKVDRLASESEIHAAYRRLARIHHPDVAENKERGHKIFLLIKEAHTVLSDPEKRRSYDEWLEASARFKARHPASRHGSRQAAHAVPPAGESHPSTCKSQQPGQGNRRPSAAATQRSDAGFDQQRPRRDDLDTFANLEITLPEAIRGGTHTLTLQSNSTDPARHDFSTFEVEVPPLAHEGLELLVHGKGRLDRVSRERGNLILTIAYARHATFRLLGTDLYSSVDIFPWDAAMGSFMRIPTLEGTATLRIPEGAQPWQKFCLPGLGMPDASGKRGDLYLTLRFMFPKTANRQQKLLWQQLKAAYR